MAWEYVFFFLFILSWYTLAEAEKNEGSSERYEAMVGQSHGHAGVRKKKEKNNKITMKALKIPFFWSINS